MSKHIKSNKSKLLLIWLTLFISITLTSCNTIKDKEQPSQSTDTATIDASSISDVPDYSGQPYIEIANNNPNFTNDEITTQSFESYSDMDSLGRCGVAKACVGTDIMPTEKRGQIGQVKPSGWHTVKYNNIDGKYLYNRCHLIGYQLTGENANKKNLITGTRYLNVDGMLPFEDKVTDYVKETSNHVMYRVTPIFRESNLVASGVQMEAESVEDNGAGIKFNVYVYNVQPGITIDYATGDSHLSTDPNIDSNNDVHDNATSSNTFILNRNTHKFHKPDCPSVKDIKPQNKKEFTGDRDELLKQGYNPCGRCKP